MADITPKDLVDILQDRDLSASYDELQKAFRADQHGAMKNWMNEHLASEVLLTKEELALCVGSQYRKKYGQRLTYI
jgi:hypothetical protein